MQMNSAKSFRTLSYLYFICLDICGEMSLHFFAFLRVFAVKNLRFDGCGATLSGSAELTSTPAGRYTVNAARLDLA
jgi:hypothetical protein